MKCDGPGRLLSNWWILPCAFGWVAENEVVNEWDDDD